MPDSTEGLTYLRERVTQVAYKPQEVCGILSFIGFDLDGFRRVLLENCDSFFKRSNTFSIINNEGITGVEIKIKPMKHLVVELVLDFGGEKVILSYVKKQYILHHASSSTYMNSFEEVEFMQTLFKNLHSSFQAILASCSAEAS